MCKELAWLHVSLNTSTEWTHLRLEHGVFGRLLLLVVVVVVVAVVVVEVVVVVEFNNSPHVSYLDLWEGLSAVEAK